MLKGGAVRRATALVTGGALLLTGVALLVLPGPGLLLVLAGLLALSREFPGVRRYVDPVRDRALRAADDSVASPLRLAASVLAGAGLLAAGVTWGLRPRLPFGGWATGSGLILSGLVLLGLLLWSLDRARQARRAPTPATPPSRLGSGSGSEDTDHAVHGRPPNGAPPGDV
ncbi:PGPGW domain-containing protein [Streptomyces sp. NPDC003333]